MSRKNKLDPDEILTPEKIASTIHKANKPLSLDQILRIMKLPRREKRHVQSLLSHLEKEGTLIRSHGKWILPKNRKLIRGKLSIQRSGAGFVIPENTESGNDIFISPPDIGEAWDEDTVEVMILPSRRGPNREGRIMKLVERANKPIPALVAGREEGDWVAVPQNQGIQSIFIIDPQEADDKIKKDDLLLLLPEERVAHGIHKAKVLKNLNNEYTPETQEYLAKVENSVPLSFPSDVLREAGQLPEDPDMSDFKPIDQKSEAKAFIGLGKIATDELGASLGWLDGVKRYDLRKVPFVTIDGDDAKDFDDAVYVEKLTKGYKLMVGIADVSHYVRQDSAIDREARSRGNSYYFPLSVEPMLPEVLSNGLCSLNPNKVRLAMVAEIYFDDKGKELNAIFYRAIIESKARLTYNQVYAAQIEKDPTAIEFLKDHMEMLGHAFDLSGKLAKKRDERGSLDFDLPEPEFRFDKEGKVMDIIPRVQNQSHNLIEEFMVAANEAVARFLTSKHTPLLYRSHESPDPEKLGAFKLFIEQANLADIPPSLKRPQGRSRGGKDGDERPPSPKELMQILRSVKGTPQEYTVNRLLLRAMMQAKYSPDIATHFGLASVCYCHFTSPIRRYADLVVHRAMSHVLAKEAGILKSQEWTLPQDLKGNIVLEGMEKKPKDKSAQKALISRQEAQTKQRSKVKKDKEASFKDLNTIADHINQTERSAMVAERETHKRLSALYLTDKIGETFAGIISGVTDFGIFVELPSCLSEGMIRLGELDDDYYEFFPERQVLRGKRTGKSYALGQPLDVFLTDVVLSRMEVNLLPADMKDKKSDPNKNAPRGRRNDSSKRDSAQNRQGKRSRPTKRRKPQDRTNQGQRTRRRKSR